jgi:hypothetical protein
VPECPRWQFDEGELGEQAGKGCPASTKIGWTYEEFEGHSGGLPVYNIVPPPGVAAQFGFDLSAISVLLDAKVRSGGDYGITVHVNNVPERKILFSSTTIWGQPSEPGFDVFRQERQPDCVVAPGGGCVYLGSQEPFLTLPTSCGAPPVFSAEMRGTWQDIDADATAESEVHNNAGEAAGLRGCGRLVHFEPSALVVPDTSLPDSPTGLTVDVKVPQGANPEGLATSGVQDTTVTTPEGLVVNPGQATGLVACQPSQEHIGGAEAEDESQDVPAECPAASKIGTDEISTPLLRDKLQGDIYILGQDPPNVQVLLAASADGVNLKLVGNIHLNEATGQLTTSFDETPNLPFTDLKLFFSSGAQAALATPTGCGVYEATGSFVPWSSPAVEDALTSNRFQIGGPGVACPSPLPFAPVLTAGSTSDQAAGYTNFTMLLQRGDEQQRISSLAFQAPEGLSGMISKVPLCGEPQAAQGSCPESTQIGHTVVTAGPGPYPFQVPQAGAPAAPIYITGPYEGAPFGLSIVVPVVAGPFDLGTIVVRAKIEVDRRTAQVIITTGTLPRIIAGIPTDLRTIDAVIDRSDFMFNPSNCDAMEFKGTAYSYEGSEAHLSSPFQVGSCRSLAFKPDFEVSTSGKTSKALGASLTAKIVYPASTLEANQASSQANIAKVRVELPKRLPSQLKTLQKACLAAVFAANPAGCPSASVVGHATVYTPLLTGPVMGPVYFVSHGGEAFPALVMVLQGEDGVTVELEGSTFISKAGITTSTFKAVPDVPITSFELSLPQGEYSALAANGDLCTGALDMPTEFIAQNGAVIKQTTKIKVTSCPTKKKTKKAKAKKTKAKKNKKKKK